MATVAGVLFALNGTLTITALSSLPVFLLAHFVSQVSLDTWMAVYVALTACVHFFWLRVSILVHATASKVDGIIYRLGNFGQEHELGNMWWHFSKSMDLVPLLQSNTVSATRSLLQESMPKSLI
jgi:hypothetical protein